MRWFEWRRFAKVLKDTGSRDGYVVKAGKKFAMFVWPHGFMSELCKE